jgi:hypothetical protein
MRSSRLFVCQRAPSPFGPCRFSMNLLHTMLKSIHVIFRKTNHPINLVTYKTDLTTLRIFCIRFTKYKGGQFTVNYGICSVLIGFVQTEVSKINVIK